MTHQHLFDRYHLKLINSIIEDETPFEKGVDPKDEAFDKPLNKLQCLNI